MIGRYLLLVVVFFSTLGLCEAKQPLSPQEKRIQKLEDLVKEKQSELRWEYGIEIHFDGDKSTPLEVQPGLVEKGVSGGPLTLAESVEILPVIEAFLEKYPKKFIKQNLKHIYLLYELRTRAAFRKGDSLNGLFHYYSPRCIYVALWSDSTQDEQYRALHHEFSHLLKRTYVNDFPEDDWLALNGRVMFLGDKANINPERQTENIFQHGFIRRYSLMNIEEDFATLVEEYYGNPRKLRQLCRSYPKLNKKVGLFEDFYKKIGAKK